MPRHEHRVRRPPRGRRLRRHLLRRARRPSGQATMGSRRPPSQPSHGPASASCQPSPPPQTGALREPARRTQSGDDSAAREPSRKAHTGDAISAAAGGAVGGFYGVGRDLGRLALTHGAHLDVAEQREGIEKLQEGAQLAR